MSNLLIIVDEGARMTTKWEYSRVLSRWAIDEVSVSPSSILNIHSISQRFPKLKVKSGDINTTISGAKSTLILFHAIVAELSNNGWEPFASTMYEGVETLHLKRPA